MEIFNARNLLGNIIIGPASPLWSEIDKKVLALLDNSLIDIDQLGENISLTENISVLRVKRTNNTFETIPTPALFLLRVSVELVACLIANIFHRKTAANPQDELL